MLKRMKVNVFYLGIIVLVLTFLVEHFFSLDTEFISFFKGVGCGILLSGVFALIKKKIKY